MVWPPIIPTPDQLNDTPQQDKHPTDHVQASQALTELVNRWGVAQGSALVASYAGAFNLYRVGNITIANVQMTRAAITADGGLGLGVVPVGFRPGPGFTAYGDLTWAANSSAAGVSESVAVSVGTDGDVRTVSRVTGAVIFRGSMVWTNTSA